MKKLILFLTTVIIASVAAFGQKSEKNVIWKTGLNKIDSDLYEVIITGKILPGWHIYGINHKDTPTQLNLSLPQGCSLSGKTYEITESILQNGEPVIFDEAKIAQKIKVNPDKFSGEKIKGIIHWMECTDGMCSLPTDLEFTISIPAKSVVNSDTISDKKDVNKSVITDNVSVSPTVNKNITPDSPKTDEVPILALIIEAILWGFAMLLTPCVFPMVPMTISFFMKGSSSPTQGRFKAFMYGIFIVLLYTLPITIIIGATRLFGGETVTADIFNWLATHWLPNIIFFVVFLIFAASFFGAFEITLPDSIVNKSDKNSDRKGLAGVFFMALTLVLVSFSCTGPIVGSVLIKSTQGQFWTPMITMLAFSVAFALPFTVIALFPSLLDKMKKGNGAWLNSVKVVLGFIEIALGLKFLSIPDQTYHWGLLDREIYLAIWIVVFTLLGLYLLGKIRFKHDEPIEHIGILRLATVIVVFSFVVYMIPGMFGAPLKALSGYIPPMETQDFAIGNLPQNIQNDKSSVKDEKTIPLALGLRGYTKIEDGLEEAKKQGKPLFIDITGHGCTNCREMEQRVWSDPRVRAMLKDRFVITALYTDDKTTLEEKDWVKAENGQILKDLGRVNAYIVRNRFGVNAQPNYAILSLSGELLVPVRGYNLNVDEYIDFLQSGINAFEKQNQ